jgi:hypothetical protein
MVARVAREYPFPCGPDRPDNQGRAYALVAFGSQILVAQILVFDIAPVALAYPQMEHLGQGLRRINLAP